MVEKSHKKWYHVIEQTKLSIQAFKIACHLPSQHLREKFVKTLGELLEENGFITKNMPNNIKKTIINTFEYWKKKYFGKESPFGEFCDWR